MQKAINSLLRFLRRSEIPHILRIQTTVIKAINDFMFSRNFIQLLPILTSKFTDPLSPDPNSSIQYIPKIKYNGFELCLTQSMILHKQLALASGLKKIFIMSPNIRLENSSRRRSGRHLFEFTQMDFEVAYASMFDIMNLVEDLLIHILWKVNHLNREDLESLNRDLRMPRKPFDIYTSHELIETYGEDWEDKASQDHREPFWVICHKREFYDKEDENNPGHYKNYDLIYPEGFGEALSGGEREYQYERLVKRMKDDGLNLNLYREYLLIAKEGLLIPSAGGGLGIERLIRFITGAKHIGDIRLFRRVPGEDVIF